MPLKSFNLLISCACITLLGYMAWHAFDGPRSFENAKKLQTQIEVLDASHQAIVRKREALERKIVLLRPKTLDLDLLDEMARRVLGYASRGDVLIPIPSPPSSPPSSRTAPLTP